MFGFDMRLTVRGAAMALGLMLGGQALAQTSALEFAAAGNGQTGAAGINVLTVSGTLTNNTDNPTGNTFAAVSPAPNPTVTFDIINNLYNFGAEPNNPQSNPTLAPPATTSSTRSGAFFGANNSATPNNYFGAMTTFGAPANSLFSSLPTTPGAGIDATLNYGARLGLSTLPLKNANLAGAGRYEIADVRVTFSTPVDNPILHLTGMGGSAGGKGFNSEFTFLPAASSASITGMTKISGNGALTLTGNQINHNVVGASGEGSTCTDNKASCGSIQFLGKGVTTITLKMFMSSSSTIAWGDSFDAFYISTSVEISDVVPVLTPPATPLVPGVPTQMTLTCTNNGPNTARGAFCAPSLPPGDPGTITNIVCTPAVSQATDGSSTTSIGSVAPNNKSVCTFDYTLPPGGTQTSVVINATGGASNDRFPSNTSATINVPVRAPKLTVVKALAPIGRETATDQFKVTIAGTGGPVTATTTGSAALVSSNTATLATATAGQQYTLTDAAAGTTNLAAYGSAYACTNTLVGGTAITSGTTTSFMTPALKSGDDITCTFTNTFLNQANLVTEKTVVGGTNLFRDGETVTFEIKITNQGPAIAKNVTLTDLLPTAALTPTASNGTVTAGTYVPATGLWTIPSMPVNGVAILTLEGVVKVGLGGTPITNTTTTPVGTTNDPSPSGDDLTETVTVEAINKVSVVKTGSLVDTNLNAKTDVGDFVEFSFVVVNTGNTPLTNVTVTDPAPGLVFAAAPANPVPTLAPGATVTLKALYPITQANLEATFVSNQATVSGTPPSGTPVTDLSHPRNTGSGAGKDAPTLVSLTRDPKMAVTKTSVPNLGGDGLLNAGDTIEYTYVVQNIGNNIIYNAGVTEEAANFTGTGPLPVPVFVQTPTAPVVGVPAVVTTPAVAAVAPIPAVTTVTGAVITPAVPAVAAVPAVIATPAIVALPSLPGGADLDTGAGTATDLVPGDKATFKATYTITQADMNAGTLSNEALATADGPNGPLTDKSHPSIPSDSADTPTITLLPATPSVKLVKPVGTLDDVNGNGRADAGDRLEYPMTVTNDGTVSLTAVTVTDPLPGTVVTGTIASLAPGATDSTTIKAVHTLTQAEIDLGTVTNTATVTGTPPSGPPVTDVSGSAVGNNTPTPTPITKVPAMSMVKALGAAAPANFSAVGVSIPYTFTVTNTGNVTLPNAGADLIKIDDPKIPAVPGVVCPATPILPGASIVCTGALVTTQADIDAGSIANTAKSFTGPPGTPTLESPPSIITIPAVQNPAMTMVKSTIVTAPGSFVQGAVIPYTYVVTNSGNTTITTPITVTDNKISAVTCPALPVGGLAPLAMLTCNGSYTVTAGDIAFGSLSNNAEAVSGPIKSPPATFTIPSGGAPAITTEKTLLSITNPAPADPIKFDTLGQILTYNFKVTNTGTASFASDVTIFDDKITPLSGGVETLCFDSVGGTLTFAPGNVVNCTATYTVTQADLDAGKVVNTATANTIANPSSPNPVPVSSPPVSKTVDALPTVDPLNVSKSASPSTGIAVGDTITYTITTTNNGNQTLKNIVVTDPKIPTLTCAPVITPALTLAPAASISCTGTYVATQADVDKQSVPVTGGPIANTATVTAATPNGTPVSKTGSTTATPETPDPELTFVKTSAVIDTNGNGVTDVGDVISYTFDVTNSGNQTMTNVAVTDASLTPSAIGTIPSLAVGASQTFTRDVPITQAQLDATTGDVPNTAEVVGTPPSGTPVPPVPSTVNTPLVRAPSSTVDKTAAYVDTNANGLQDAGDTINYTIVVKNTGNTTITGAALADPLLAPLTIPATLAPGQTVTVNKPYVLTQADVDAGVRNNTATLTGSTSDGTPVPVPVNESSTVSVPITPSSSIALSKAGTLVDVNANGVTDAGDTITYAFTVKNTGSTTLTAISVTDPLAGIVLTGGPIASLAPGATDSTTLTGSLTLTQAMIDSGKVDNQATVSGTPPSGPPVTDNSGSGLTPPAGLTNDTPTSVALPSAPKLAVVKTSSIADTNGSGRTDAGDIITYAFDVENTGNVTLTNVVVTDPLPGLVMSGGPLASLAPAASDTTTFTGTYTITQADVNAGKIANQATASGTPPTGPKVSDTSDETGKGTGDNDPTETLIPADPKLSLLKTGGLDDANGNGLPDAGEKINYTFTVENTGNVTLTNVTISDPLPGVVVNGGPLASLLPGAVNTSTFTAAVTLTQAMIDTGSLTNTATVSGLPPAALGLPPTTDLSDDPIGPGLGGNDPTVVPLTSAPKLAVDKKLAAASPASFSAAGVVLTYEFVVTNTGNVTVANTALDPVQINDSLILSGITCPTGAIAPGASITCTGGTLSTTQANIDAGGVTNTATAFKGPIGSPTLQSLPDSVTVPSVKTPELTMAKTNIAPVPATFQVGSVYLYEYVITNTGNTTITNPVTVTDNRVAATSCPALPVGGLLPLASITCTGSYTVTSTDTSIGSVTNNAYGSDGFTRSNTGSVTVPVGAPPALSIVKTLSAVNGVAVPPSTFAQAGDVLTYSYTATNTGGAAFASNVLIEDDKISPSGTEILCHDALVDPVTGIAADDFNPGDTCVITADYAVTQDDLDLTKVTNTAYASSVFAPLGANLPIQAPAVELTVNSASDPELTLVKTASPASGAAVGDVITYSITATNTGNQTLSAVDVSDPKLSVLTCDVTAPISLAPGGQTVCSGPYTVTQADVDAETIGNTATATSSTPQGTAVNETASATHIPEAQDPAASIVKTGVLADTNGNGKTDPGDTVTYSFLVENTGNQTLTDVAVDDPKFTPSLIGTIATMAPGDKQTLTKDYVLTQTDIDSATGNLTNTATVTGDDPDGTAIPPTPATSSTENTSMNQTGVISLVKTGVVNDTNANFANDVGETITYTFTVKNQGNVTLTNVTLSDPLANTVLTGSPIASLAPGATGTITGVHTLSVAEVAAGKVDNQASVTAKDPVGGDITDDSDESGDTPSDNDPTSLDLNRTPVTTDDGSTGNDTGVPVTIDPLANDSDADGAADLDPTSVLLTLTGMPVDATLSPDGKTVTVPGEGVWTVDPVTGAITFTPELGATPFTANPTPVRYTVADDAGARTDDGAKVTLEFDPEPPVAVADTSNNNKIGSNAVVNVLGNDNDPDGTLVPASVNIIGSTAPGEPLFVPGEGTWSVNTTTGAITFDPLSTFTGDPTPIEYTVEDNDGNLSDPVSVTVDYTTAPVANDDTSAGNTTNTPVTVNPLLGAGADTFDADQTLDAASVVLTATGAPAGSTLSPDGKTLTVPGEGEWTVDAVTGAITFTPETGYTASPTPVSYTVADNQGNVSNEATVTITYTPEPPVAEDDVVSDVAIGANAVVDPFADNGNGADADPDGALDKTTVKLLAVAGATLSADGKTLTVPGEGVWTVNATTGVMTFDPEDGFITNPTPVSYTVADNDGNVSNAASVTVEYTPEPAAVNDTSSNNQIGVPAVVDVIGNDTAGPGRTIDPATIQIVGSTGPGAPLVVAGEGTWSVDTATGEITFTPLSTFTGDPAPISYSVKDDQGNVVPTPATVTVDYTTAPVANDDTSAGNTTNTPVTVNPLLGAGADTFDADQTLDAASVVLTATGAPAGSTLSPDGKTLTVPGEGEWTVDAVTGAITFTPETGYTASPTPVSYTVADNQGNVSNEATVTITYTPEPPVAEDDALVDQINGATVSVPVLGNDNDPDGNLDATSVKIVGAAGTGKSLVVAGEGTWTVDPVTGAISFDPEAGFTGNPTPIDYTMADNDGNLANAATVSITYTPLPDALDDTSLDNEVGTPATLSLLANDTAGTGRTLDPTSVKLVAVAGSTLSADGKTLTVLGQGVWTVDATGNLTFTPEADFFADPTPITYTVADDQGNVSAPATATVTYLGIPEIALTIDIAKVIDTNGDGKTGVGDKVVYRFKVKNTGPVPVNNVTVDVDSLALPMPNLVCTPVNLLPGEEAELECTEAEYTITAADVARGSLVQTGQVAGVSNSNVEAISNEAQAALALSAEPLSITKTAGVSNIAVGQIVPYTLVVKNPSAGLVVVTDVVDLLPAGLVYQKGSGTVAGADKDPVINGSTLTFKDVSVPAQSSVTITLDVFVSGAAQPGALTNRAQARNPNTGALIAAEAEATVMLGAEAVFDCGTVVGRVFDDKNQNGYMDGPDGEDRGLTDDDIYTTGKYGKFTALPDDQDGERGIPNVRLVSVNGVIITTDKYGRFSVPCADLPRDIGSNYLLKLDERSLPSGYRMTTENPRDVRLTAGKMTKMNFGASITRLVKVNLSDAAFGSGDQALQPRPELDASLRQMVAQIADTPSMLQLLYAVGSDGDKVARQRLKVIERRLRALWSDNGQYKLNIEAILKRAAQRAGNE